MLNIETDTAKCFLEKLSSHFGFTAASLLFLNHPTDILPLLVDNEWNSSGFPLGFISF